MYRLISNLPRAAANLSRSGPKCSKLVVPVFKRRNIFTGPTTRPGALSAPVASSLKFLEPSDIEALQSAKLDKRGLLYGYLTQQLSISVDALTSQGKVKMKQFLSFDDLKVSKFVELFKEVFPTDLDAASEERVEQLQRQILGPLFKKTVPTNKFNPETGFVPLWMPLIYQNDPVHLQLKADLQAEKPFEYYTLRSISGSGKTGVIFQLSREFPIFYVQCQSNVRAREFGDETYISLFNYVNTYARSTDTEKNCLVATVACQLFWLAKAIAFEWFSATTTSKQNLNQDWLQWTTDGGNATIKTIQDEHLNASSWHNMDNQTLQTLSNKLATLLSNFWVENHIYIAIDEAQVAYDQFVGNFKSPSTNQLMSFISVLLFYSLTNVKRIICGTRLSMTKLEEILISGIVKPDAVWRLPVNVKEHIFPFTTPNDVLETIKLYYNLDTSDSADKKQLTQLLERISNTLQGRLQFTTDFLRQVYQVAKAKPGASTYKILNDAFTATTLLISMTVNRNLNKMNAFLASVEPALCSKLLFHLTDVAFTSFLSHKNVEFSQKVFEQQFVQTIEDAGVFAPVPNTADTPESSVVSYTILEPYTLEVMLAWLTLKQFDMARMFYTRLYALLSKDSNGFSESLKGFIFEDIVMTQMVAKGSKWLEAIGTKFQPLSWAFKPKCSWTVKGSVGQIPQLLRALSVVQSNIGLLQQFYETHDTDIMQQLQGIFNDDEVLRQCSWKEPALLTLHEACQLPNSPNRLEHIMEFIYLLARPMNIVIHPTNQFGPHILGWMESKEGTPCLVVISQSFYAQTNTNKHNSNEAVAPSDWFKSYMPGRVVLKDMIQRNLLPFKRVQLDFTLPKAKKETFEYTKQPTEVLKIHVGIDNLPHLIPSNVAKLFSDYYKSYKQKKASQKIK